MDDRCKWDETVRCPEEKIYNYGAGVPDDFPRELVRGPDRSVEVPRHDQEALDLRNNPETPVWLSHAIGYALTRDPVKVWQQLDVVTEVFKRRMDAIFREHGKIVP